jgi:hypothetical protein
MPSEKELEERDILERNIDNIKFSLSEIDHHTNDLDGTVFTVQSSKGATTRAALIQRESNNILQTLGKIWGNATSSSKPETPSEEALKKALKLAREWLTEYAPTEHDLRCQRLRDANTLECRCTIDAYRDDVKVIDAALGWKGEES